MAAVASWALAYCKRIRACKVSGRSTLILLLHLLVVLLLLLLLSVHARCTNLNNHPAVQAPFRAEAPEHVDDTPCRLEEIEQLWLARSKRDVACHKCGSCVWGDARPVVDGNVIGAGLLPLLKAPVSCTCMAARRPPKASGEKSAVTPCFVPFSTYATLVLGSEVTILWDLHQHQTRIDATCLPTNGNQEPYVCNKLRSEGVGSPLIHCAT
eukprot:357773-Chlamydomonas_euryale.AAC.7